MASGKRGQEPSVGTVTLPSVSVGATDPAEVLAELERTACELKKANARMRQELEAAALVQQSLLPNAHFKVPNLNLAWHLRPCQELAGDLLNCIRLDEHSLGFFVLDVSGHGVSSALLSVQVSRLMSPMMSESLLLKQPLRVPPWYRLVEPKDVLERLNTRFQMNTDLAQYFTILYGTLELATGRLRFASAGHPGPIHVPAAGEAVAFRCASHPVGFFDDPRVAEGELTLAAGDRLWIFSDGMTEVFDSEQRELGVSGLQDWLIGQQGIPVDKAVCEAMTMVENWCGPKQPDDDCTILAIEAQA